MLGKQIEKILNLNHNVLSINQRNVEYIYNWNPRRYFQIADDKALTKTILSELKIPAPETIALIKYMGDINEKWKIVKEFTSFAIKPAHGKAGGGILVLDKKGERWTSPSGSIYDDRAIKKHIADIIFGNYSNGVSDTALVEEKINQHKIFSNIYPSGVADIRIIIFKGNIIMAMCRIPTNESNGKANLHQGALGVGIDITSGKLQQGYNYKQYMDKHPDTGFKFSGIPILYWSSIIRMSKKIACNLPLKYLGVDIILDHKKGPMVMEINVRPGLEIQNVNKQGLLNLLN